MVLAQVLLSALAWAALAAAVIVRLRFGWVGWTLALLSLVLSLTAPVWSWNTLLGSESTAIAISILWLASVIWLSGRPTILRLVAGVAASTLLLATRPQLLVFIAVSSMVVLVWAARARGEWRVPLAAGVALLPGLGWATYRLLALAGEPAYRMYYALNNVVDKGGSYRVYALQRAPECEPLNALLSGPQPWTDIFGFRADGIMSACPEAYLWYRGPEASTVSWLLSSPINAASDFWNALPRFVLPVYTEGRGVPGPLSELIPPQAPMWLVSLVALLMGVVFAFLAGARWRVTLGSVLGLLAVLGAAAVTALLIWAADGIEHDRHLQPLATIIAAAALTMPAALTAPRRACEPSRAGELDDQEDRNVMRQSAQSS